MSGTLYVLGTPIGNLEDMTFRSLRLLKEVDYIVCEDTRHTLKLTNYFEIDTKGRLISYHEHNKKEKGLEILKLLQNGNDIGIVTDAGMPCISDPGEDLIKLCYDHGVVVTSAPGPTAVITGLVLSGLSTRSYIFDGFLPTNNKKRIEMLETYSNEQRTIILYESPHHIKKTLKELSKYITKRKVSIAREITKKFEEVLKGSCDELVNHFIENEPRGEMVIIIEGISSNELEEIKLEKWDKISVEDHFNMYINEGMSKKDAMKKVAKDKNMGKREIYKILEEGKSSEL